MFKLQIAHRFLLTDYTPACLPSPKVLAAGDRQAGMFTDAHQLNLCSSLPAGLPAEGMAGRREISEKIDVDIRA